VKYDYLTVQISKLFIFLLQLSTPFHHHSNFFSADIGLEDAGIPYSAVEGTHIFLHTATITVFGYFFCSI